jgi:DNA polymerase-3 subunit delta'
VHFQPLAEEVVRELVRAQGLEEEALLGRLARLSGGSPGQALALADPALWEFRRSLLEGLIQPRCDTVALAQAWIQFVEEAGKEAAAQRRRASMVLRFLIQVLSAALTLSVGGTPSLVESEDLRILEQLIHRADAASLLDLLDRCFEADFQIERRAQLVLVLEALLDSLGQELDKGK